MDDPSRLNMIKQKFIEDLGQYFESYGVSDIMGRIWALLIFAPAPLSLTEIAKKLKVTKAAVSINIKTLRLSGLVEKVTIPSDRSDYYQLNADYGHSIFASSHKKVQNGLDVFNKTLGTLNNLPETNQAMSKELNVALRRINAIKDLYEFHNKMLLEIMKYWSENHPEI